MKRFLTKNLKTVLCFALALCTSLSVCFAFGFKNVKAEETVSTSSLFTLKKVSGNATVETQKTLGGHTGVFVGPTQADYGVWSVDVGNVFYGDFELEYTLPSTYENGYFGALTFCVKDLNGNEAFRVVRQKYSTTNSADYGGLAYVYDGSYYYSINRSNEQTRNTSLSVAVNHDDEGSYGFYPYSYDKNDVAQTGKIVFEWQNDKINVKLTRMDTPGKSTHTSSEVTVATLDGNTLKGGYKVSIAKSDAEKSVWGTTISTISSSKTVNSESALLLSVNGVSLDGETVTGDISGSSKVKSTELSSLFTLTNNGGFAVVEPNTTVAGNTGVLVGPALGKADWKNWSVDLSGSFKGDFELEYALPRNESYDSAITFTVNNLDGNEAFRVVRSRYGTTDSPQYGGLAYVYDGSYYYSINKNNEQTKNTSLSEKKNENEGYIGFYPYSYDKNEVAKTGKIVLEWTDDNKVNIKLTRLNTPLSTTDLSTSEVIVATLDGSAIKDGYKISIGNSGTATSIWGTNVNTSGTLVSAESALLVAVNGIPLTGKNVPISENTNVKHTLEELVDGKNVIEIEKGGSLGAFTVENSVFVGTAWNVSKTSSEYNYSEDFSAKDVGTYDISVFDKAYTVNVVAKTAKYSLVMESGASVRCVETDLNATENSNGLRFTMDMPKTDYEALMANVGDGKTYDGATFGMVIMPYSYVRTYGDINEANLFGVNAKYTWGENAATDKTKVLNLTRSDMYFDAEKSVYKMSAAIVNILDANIATKFVARGYVALTVSDTTTYIFADYAGNDVKNNVRTVYDVAKAAVNAENGGLDAEQKNWLNDKYISKCAAITVEYYTVTDGTASLAEKVETVGVIGATVYGEYRSFDGYTLDKNYTGTVYSATLSGDGVTLKYYFVKDDTEV